MNKRQVAIIGFARDSELAELSPSEIEKLFTKEAKNICFNVSDSQVTRINQIMIEHHVNRCEIEEAMECAIDYFDSIDSGVFEFDGEYYTKEQMLEANAHDEYICEFVKSADLFETCDGSERVA